MQTQGIELKVASAMCRVVTCNCGREDEWNLRKHDRCIMYLLISFIGTY